MKREALSRGLDVAHRRLREESTLHLELETLDQLLDAEGRHESGVDTLVGVLASARRLPETLMVRVAVTETDDESAVEAAFREHCRDEAEKAWRAAVTIKSNGLRQLPLAVLVATTLGALAAGAGYLADAAGGNLVAIPLYVVAGIGMIAAWASAWLPIEEALFDWRAPAHLAAAYELLAGSRLEIVERSSAPREAAAAREPAQVSGAVRVA